MSKPQPAHQVYRPRHHLFFDNLIGGIAWGLGSVIGATVVVALIGVILTRLETAPLFGSFIHFVVEEVKNSQ